jgi:hypothetical protein
MRRSTSPEPPRPQPSATAQQPCSPSAWSWKLTGMPPATTPMLAASFSPKQRRHLTARPAKMTRRGYSPLPPPEPLGADQRIRAARRDSGQRPPSALRPCVPGSGAVGRTDGAGRSGIQTVRRSGMPAVLRHRLAAELPLQAAGSL